MKKIHLPPYKETVLIFQGGGALGAYQCGAYDGLARAGIEPTWLAGISIGAINSAIVAGNPPEKRVERMHEFWDTVCRPPSITARFADGMASMMGLGFESLQQSFEHMVSKTLGSYAAAMAVMEGQNEFFYPRPFAPGFGSPSQVSFYDTSPLRGTLERLVDFDRINHKDAVRLSLGATNVGTGNFVYFDNRYMTIGPEHVMASGSLPPGFPATEIDGEFYWDGGCVSNTPLLYVLTENARVDTLIFQVDLWSARGKIPTNVLEVSERQKDIQYSSRTRIITDAVRAIHIMRQRLMDTLDRIPESVKKADPFFAKIREEAMGASTNVIQLIYQNKGHEGHYKDCEFSAETMVRHWGEGLGDVEKTLSDPSCLKIPPKTENFVTYDIHRKERFTPTSPDPNSDPRNPAFIFETVGRNVGMAAKSAPTKTPKAPAKKAAVRKPAAKKRST